MTTTSWRSGRIWLIALARSEAVAGAASRTTRPLTTGLPGRSSVKSMISIDLLTQIIVASNLPMLPTVGGCSDNAGTFLRQGETLAGAVDRSLRDKANVRGLHPRQ